MRRAALHNLGCKVNAYETEAMRQILEDAGYEIVPFRERADVYIVNTCSVTNVADHKSRQMLHRAKKMNPGAVVVAVGCYVQSAEGELKKDPAVDLVVGNNQKARLAGILEEYFQGAEGAEARVADMSGVREYEGLSLRKTAGHTRAFIKVQDGCSQFCSYCIIPYTRGRVRSRRPEEVEAEVRRLVEGGYREVVLTGIHLSSYGLDFQQEKTDLLYLIRRIHGIPGLDRIRLGSLEPRVVTAESAAALASLEKVCPHFHLSLQSGCDATLKRMNRRYTAGEYEEACGILRDAFDRPAVTTDVIVGFPGETGEEFDETERFLARIRLSEMHVFKYSRRAGTRAASMAGQVPEPVKAARSERLIGLGNRMAKEYRSSLIGKQVEALLEEPAELGGKTYWTGHTREYLKVALPGEEGGGRRLVRGCPSRFLTEEILLMSSRHGGGGE